MGKPTNLNERQRKRLRAKIDVRGKDECWPYTGARRNGYGDYCARFAHRCVYEMEFGVIPEHLVVRHLCGNKLCVNPAHLRAGTAKENAQDQKRLGEIPEWSPQKSTKLSEADARYIVANPDNERGIDLAAKFGVSKATISLVQKGERWARVR